MFHFDSITTFSVFDLIAANAPSMSGSQAFLLHMQKCANRVTGSQMAMKWTETFAGSHLATAEQFRDFSGWQEGAEGSFQDEKTTKSGRHTLTCIKDIFTNPDWIHWVTGFHNIPG
jgi:hypothetical protein